MSTERRYILRYELGGTAMVEHSTLARAVQARREAERDARGGGDMQAIYIAAIEYQQGKPRWSSLTDDEREEMEALLQGERLAQIIIPCTRAEKGACVRASRAAGIKLADWARPILLDEAGKIPN